MVEEVYTLVINNLELEYDVGGYFGMLEEVYM